MDLSAERVTLNKLFAVRGEQFTVPPYQRPYAWEPEHVDELWHDIIGTMDKGHFLGSVVLNVENEECPQIIDGQQRLTTLALILALIRDLYWELSDKRHNRPHSLLVADQYATGDDVWKLRTGDVNWKVFRDFVLREPQDTTRHTWTDRKDLTRTEQARNEAIFTNLQRLHDRLRSYVSDENPQKQAQDLERIETSIVNRLEFVVIKVGSVADAFLLFETMNDRGLQLSAGDLLKNHLLARTADEHKSREAVDEAADEWEGLLEDIGVNTDITRFLRHYLLIQYPEVRKDDVFDRFKGHVKEMGPDSILRRLRTFGRIYGEFVDPTRCNNEIVREVLEDLATLRAVQCYIALMPARHELSDEDFVRFARLTEILTYRYSTITQLGANELERSYHLAAKALAKVSDDPTQLEVAWERLIRMIPDSTQFMAAFQAAQMGRQYNLRYTLRRIEEHLVEPSSVEKTWKPPTTVHIEHIMPQTLSQQWTNDLGEWADEHEGYVNRWGNLTLLYDEFNREASNRPFGEKKQAYAKSELVLNRYLAEYSVWNPDAIQKRQRWLAELADQIWSVEAIEGRKITIPDLSTTLTE